MANAHHVASKYGVEMALAFRCQCKFWKIHTQKTNLQLFDCLSSSLAINGSRNMGNGGRDSECVYFPL